MPEHREDRIHHETVVLAHRLTGELLEQFERVAEMITGGNRGGTDEADCE